MDKIDLKIIQLLKANGRMTCSEISKKVLLSVPAVAERIRKLEEEKIIRQFTVRLNRKKLDLNLLAFVLVSLDKSEYAGGFRETVAKSDWILECHNIAGEYDYLLKVVAENTEKLEIYISQILKKTAGVAKTNTIVVLSTLKEEM
ncbi:MAG: Lrp/AsnC family transcriptional regulator [Peptococcaceae bacterium]|jgi:Lrp/AsnC family leucine-responsive transcriptional regulator|nr:Lrp/AsnC family transcriptional regulator [Peptococcaceae bacterium]MDH7524015.1 Lrp/AsnC family transcriptional regulator [Peptococcaceae bacterium]